MEWQVFDNGFRLIGLAERGSIPLMLVCLLALFSTFYIRLASLKLSVQSRSKKEDSLMRQKTNQFSLVVYAVLETIWAIGASGIAGALPA
jgi:hypothetical protein